MALRTVHFGIGALGTAVAIEALRRPALKVVGAIDADPLKVGNDLGAVLGLESALGVTVLEPTAESWPDADVVLHTTTSHLADVAPQLEACIQRGLDIVSSCEELAFPYVRHPDLAARLDDLAKTSGVRLLGTGVNPGFVMDTLPLVLSGVSCDIESVALRRVLDATNRRLPFQRKIGAGLSKEEFALRAASGRFGHIGLAESAIAVARAFGWEPYEIEDRIEPVFATRPVTSAYAALEAGDTAGLRQHLVLKHDGREVLTMELIMAMGAEDPRDEVRIEGDPPVHMIIQGGIQGDRATVGIMLNAAEAIGKAPPGLLTMRDLPVVHWRPA